MATVIEVDDDGEYRPHSRNEVSFYVKTLLSNLGLGLRHVLMHAIKPILQSNRGSRLR